MSNKARYRIEISYRTGNSFGSEDTTDLLEETWTNLDIAKDNLNRIKLHHEYYKYKESINRSWGREKVVEKPDCYIENDSWGCDTIVLILDGGEEWKIYPYWHGYFEELYGAEIVCEENTDMKFVV